MVWALCIIYFARTGSNYGLGLFMPQIIKAQGYTNMQTGWIMLVPYVIGCIAMLAFGWSSDRHKERKWHLIVAFVLITGGLWGAGLLGPTTASLVVLCVATIGGFAGPYMLGWAKQFSTNFSSGLYMLGCLGILGMVFTLFAVKSQKTDALAPQTPDKKATVQAD
jgi:ACS family tartrate transporter-like MFS transporter